MHGRTFGNVLEGLADRFPNDLALVEGDRRWTFSELVSEFRAVGQALRDLGLRPGDRVGLLMKDSSDLVFAMYGGFWSGITTVPLNSRLSASDHAYMLADAEVKALLFHHQTADHVAKVLAERPIPNALVVGSPVGALPRLDVASVDRSVREPLDVEPEAPIWAQFTGGTTGRPKAVVHSHRTMLSTLISCTMEYEIRLGERCVHVAPLTHAGAAVLLPVWLRGGYNILINDFDVERMLEAIEEHRATMTHLVPTMMQVLCDSPRLAHTDLSSMRAIVYGAAPITEPLLRKSIAAFGPILIQAYAQVEVFAQGTILGMADHVRALSEPRLLSSAGRPVALAEVHIADESGTHLPPGEFGEIIIRGPHMFLEYLNKPEQTAEAKVDGWLHTGDMGHIDEDGYLFITDRKKDVVITGGFNVYPREVESVIIEHPDVAQCCVIGLADDKWGEQVTAVVVAAEGVADHDELAAQVIAMVREAKGPVYTPKSVVVLDAIPLTAVGKYDKKALVSQLRST